MRRTKQTVIYLYNRILFSQENGHVVGMYENIDKLKNINSLMQKS